MSRKPIHPWDEIRTRFVQGEEVEGGKAPRRWPTAGELAAEYKIHPVQFSRVANKKGPDGQTWNDQREVFKRDLQRKYDAKVVDVAVGTQVKINAIVVQSSARLLSDLDRSLRNDDHSPGSYNQIAGAMAKAQKVGNSSADKLKSDSAKGQEKEIDDWTLMSHIRRGGKLEDLIKRPKE